MYSKKSNLSSLYELNRLCIYLIYFKQAYPNIYFLDIFHKVPATEQKTNQSILNDIKFFLSMKASLLYILLF